MIPKKIHYIWVGPNDLTALAQECIASWHRYLPDYEIKFWNEENFPHMEHSYVRVMYQKKMWAFVSDYMRFWILYHEGGIYLDTDMEVLKSLDTFHKHDIFMGNTADGHIACGIIGSVPHTPFMKHVLALYDADTMYSTHNTSPRMVDRACQVSPAGTVHIEPYTTFYPCIDGMQCDPNIRMQAYTNHHWAESWVCCRMLRKLLRRLGILVFVKNILTPIARIGKGRE